jgi:hypothetical protein
MSAEKGSAFLLKVGDGGAPPVYATVAGMRTTQMSVNGEAVNVTSKDSGGWRELLSGAGVRSISVAGSGWRFVGPAPGMLVWNLDLDCWLHWTGGGWSDGSIPASAFTIAGQQVVGPRLADVPSPSGGTTIDAEARAAVDAVIATLKSHGLID